MVMTKEERIAFKKKKAEELSKEQAEELKRSLTVRERLERKAELDTIRINVDDDLDGFEVKFRKLNPSEQDHVANLMTISLPAAKDESEKNKIMDGIYEILGAASKDEPPLDGEFWKSKIGWTTDMFLAFITKVIALSSTPDPKYMEEIKKFRNQ